MDVGSPNSKDEGGRKTARRRSAAVSEGRVRFGVAAGAWSLELLGARRPADTGSSQKVVAFDGSGGRARVDLVEGHYAGKKENKDAKETQPEEGSSVQTQAFRSEQVDGSVVTKTVRTTTTTARSSSGGFVTTIEVQTTTETETKDGAKRTSVSTETRMDVGNGSAGSVTEDKMSLDESAGTEHEGHRSFMFGGKRRYHKQWLPQFVSYLDRRDKRVDALSTTDLLECAREFCRANFAEFSPELFNGESTEESKACWEKSLIIMDEVIQGFDSENCLRKEVAVSMLGQPKSEGCQVFDDLLVLKCGEVLYHGAGEDTVEYIKTWVISAAWANG
ncbi:hypothetical protein PHYPSEUDO_013667 [Phytophthora pseudosyringae]|uniref:Uncharacterized protein n=1 Tax=Phytophthora pseudosyringae TaxID=221518 RepID=A0A8T1V7U3_9STRA|nr:hypothetical protein PHYPSEUDO_013667 [Phytophthora pseudosyringae]